MPPVQNQSQPFVPMQAPKRSLIRMVQHAPKQWLIIGALMTFVIITLLTVATLALFNKKSDDMPPGASTPGTNQISDNNDNSLFTPEDNSEQNSETEEEKAEEPKEQSPTTPENNSSSSHSGGTAPGGNNGNNGGNNNGSQTPAPYSCSGTPHIAGGPDGMGGCWPGPGNTGVPAGTTLSAYSGPCVITANNTTIDAKTITCDMEIRAANVTITRSRFVNGSVATDENSSGYSFSISDSEIQIGNRPGTGIGAVNFTANRVHITGGNRSAHCWNSCTITNSYVHGQFTDYSGTYHESGIRMGQSLTLRHNTIACDAPDVPPDAGCSAPLTGYGDFGPVQNNTIDKNLFLETTGGYCAYGGSSGGKPYSAQTNNIVFTGNVFQRGSRNGQHGNPVCGYYGVVSDFDSGRPGNIWSNNRYDNGTAINM